MDASSSSSDRDPLERLAAEYLDRRRHGEHPSLTEYVRQYPQYGDQIREFFPALEVMEGLKPDAGERTGSIDGRAVSSTSLEQLGEYRILREIGHGGMGVVYEAIQESLGRRVALKILPFHGRVDPVQIERFRLESRSAARLHHGNIVPVYGMGEHQGVYYYAMQYIAGHGLDVILDDLRRLRAGAALLSPRGGDQGDEAGSIAVARSLLTGRFTSAPSVPDLHGVTETLASDERGAPGCAAAAPTPGPRPDSGGSGLNSVLSQPSESGYYRAVARLVAQVAQALAHAHQQGILHRDIKPSNLLLDPAGHPWVTDFGLAKVEAADGPTQTGDIVGTLRYMAPERFEGWSDRRSDIYGLGMTLYELLTLQPAFEAVTRAALIERVIHDSPLSPRKHDPRIPRDLETIALTAIAKEPAERYATAEAFAADLENYLADRPIVARRSGPAERAWRWCRRNKAATGLMAASLVAALAMVGLVVGLAYNARLKEVARVATDARRDAEGAVEREERAGYFNRIVLAEREWLANNVGRAEQLLDECFPTAGRQDHRGWEWHYLKRLCHRERLVIRGHNEQVYRVAYSPDGRSIVSASFDHTVKIWDAGTGQQIRVLVGLEERAMCLAQSADGLFIAAGAGEWNGTGRVRVWDATDGRPCLNLTGNTKPIYGVAFSPDGRYLATAGEEGFAKIWDVKSGALIRACSDGRNEPISSVAFSPDGNRLATSIGTADLFAATQTRGELKIWDSSTGQIIQSLKGHTAPATRVIYSPDGRRLASASYDGTVRIWDATTFQTIYTLRGHTQFVNDVSFSADSARVASASEDGSVKVWDVGSGLQLFTLRGDSGLVNSVAFASDGRSIVSGNEDGTLRIWDATTSQEARTIRGSAAWITCVAFSRDGRLLVATGIDGSVRIIDVETGDEIRTLAGHATPARSAAFSPDGRLIATGSGDYTRADVPGEVKIWDVETGRAIRALSGHQGIVWSVAFSPDGHWLASAGGELVNGPGELKLWSVPTWEVRSLLEDWKSGVHSVAFSADSRWLALGDGRGGVSIWDTATGRSLRECRGHTACVDGVAFNPDGRLASAGDDKTIRIWDTATGEQLLVLRGHTNYVIGAAFSPDGRRLASASVDRTIKVWDAETGLELLTLRGHTNPVWNIAFSPDERRLASAGMDGTVRIWDATPWVELGRSGIPTSQVEKLR